MDLISGFIMIVGGLAELFFGVAAEMRSLEDIANPLSAIRVDVGQALQGKPVVAG
jgi:hypothetical protein